MSLKEFFRRLNDSAAFNPGRWPAGEALARTVGVLAVAALFFRRIFQLPSFPGVIGHGRHLETWLRGLPGLPPSLISTSFDLDRYYRPFGYGPGEVRFIWAARLAIWVLESGILLGYIVAFATRVRARSVARGFSESVFPLLMGGLPFLIVLTEYNFHQWMPAGSRMHLWVLGGIFALLVGGASLNLAALWSLRRAFTIMTEARILIRTGVYRIVRHPIYVGQFFAYLGYTFLHLHPYTVAIYALFVIGQSVRAGLEQRKLEAAFPEYEDYKKETGMFFPCLTRGSQRGEGSSK